MTKEKFNNLIKLDIKFKLILVISLVSVITGCNTQQSIEGLWTVKLVQMADQEMTPNARWTRFNSDFTQESGNGFFQHSYGTWKFNTETNELSIINTNGIEDEAPFKISILEETMTWQRTEQGQTIKIILERTDKLPETYGDKILGLWALDNLKGDGTYFSESEHNSSSDYIYFGWDRRFRLESEKGRVNGVYNVHGHKPELELIPYGGQFDRDFWKIDYGEDRITLTRLNTETEIVRTFKRIRNFPE